MSTYTPDQWVMLKFNNNGKDIYKILAGWGGSYLYGASWKLNSGVTKVELEGDYYMFHGSSGSIYQCHKNGYGLTGYTASVLESFYKDIESFEDVTLELMDEDTTDFMGIQYDNRQS